MLGLLSLAGCAAVVGGTTIGSGTVVQGSAILKTEVRAVSNFTEVAFSQVGTLIVDQTGVEGLAITADDNLLPLLTSDVAGGVLRLGAKDPNTTFQTNKPITYLLSVKTLTHLTLSGAGVTQVHNFAGTTLALDASGVGEMSVQGQADSQNVTLSGAGSYDGSAFLTKSATVKVSGTGKAVVQASETLDATVSGVGSVEYIGAPKITSHVTGVGTVRKH